MISLSIIPSDQPQAGKVGAPVAKHFLFQAIKEGKAEVQFARYAQHTLPQVTYEDVLTFDVEQDDHLFEAATGIMPGGWTPFSEPKEDAVSVFKEAFSHFTGVGYEPLLVATQVVNGVNYIFAVNGKGVYPNVFPFPALIRIYKAPHVAAKIVNIKPLSPLSSLSSLAGGYSPFLPVAKEQQDVLDQVHEKLVGSGFTAKYASVQVVAGLNYRFVGVQTLSDQAATKYPVVFTVYAPVSGSPVFTGVQKVFEIV
ncbi:MAG: hypothetical protein LBC46_06460 [Treponema sp.]|nr:hypothetical protein [Treponema sp.]